MATLVQVSGNPGTGKTFSLKALVDKYPEHSALIDVDGKGPSWAGWRDQLSKEKKNYYKVSEPALVAKALRYVSKEQPEIKVVFVDTITKMMNVQERNDMKKAGYNKWEDYAQIVFDIYNMAYNELREDLIVVFLAHIEPYDGPHGQIMYRTAIAGRKSQTRWNTAAHLNYNLYTQVNTDGEEIEWGFLTQTDGINQARSKYGVFDSYKIPNDFCLVFENIWTRDLGRNLDDLKTAK